MSFCKLQELVMDREAWHAAIHGLQSWMWLSYWTELMWRANSWRPWCFKDWRREEKGRTEDEMVGWHHWFNGHEFEQAPADGERQGSLVCCNSWGREESDTTEQLNWTELNWSSLLNSSDYFHKMENTGSDFLLCMSEKILGTNIHYVLYQNERISLSH